MRIAWLGPAGEGGGGVGLGALLLECVLRQGAEVDYYTTTTREQLPETLRTHPNLRLVHIPDHWQWGRWYSRTSLTVFISGILARMRAHRRLAKELVRRNRAQRYDCVFQWSFPELLALGKYIDELPPVVVYPGVHAAGELRWHRRESAYARQSENVLVHYLVRAYLSFRAWHQRGQLRKPAVVLALSRRFGELLTADCGLDPNRIALLYHPIAAASTAQTCAPFMQRQGPLKLLFIARISVRKGLEQIVELSKRLDDLRGQVQIDVIGGTSLWSNYTAHLKELNPNIARYRGGLYHKEMMAAYDEADIVLMPSMYEPGGIVVGEALSRGVCIVASDQVGSAEDISPECCRSFAAGDIDAFEHRTRELMKELRSEGAARLRELARREASRVFAPEIIGPQLIAILQRACAPQFAPDSAASVPVPV